jgi:hypothetical protein
MPDGREIPNFHPPLSAANNANLYQDQIFADKIEHAARNRKRNVFVNYFLAINIELWRRSFHDFGAILCVEAAL